MTCCQSQSKPVDQFDNRIHWSIVRGTFSSLCIIRISNCVQSSSWTLSLSRRRLCVPKTFFWKSQLFFVSQIYNLTTHFSKPAPFRFLLQTGQVDRRGQDWRRRQRCGRQRREAETSQPVKPVFGSSVVGIGISPPGPWSSLVSLTQQVSVLNFAPYPFFWIDVFGLTRPKQSLEKALEKRAQVWQVKFTLAWQQPRKTATKRKVAFINRLRVSVSHPYWSC